MCIYKVIMKKIIYMIFNLLCSILSDGAKFLVISDIHLDNKYYTASYDKCLLGDTGLGCCRKYDIPDGHSHPVSKFGDYNCDSPITLIDESFKWIQNNINDIDYIVYTGDSVDHHDITQSPKNNQAEINIVFKLFNKYFPDIKILYAIGNHDTYPIDQSTPYIYSKFLKSITEIMDEWLSDESKQTMQLGGYYSEIIEDLMIISLNTIYYDKNNIFKINNSTYDHQMKWFKLQLIHADDNNYDVWVIGHIPPNKSNKYFKNTFKEIIVKYDSLIKINLFGHTHKDQFLLNESGGCILVPPSMVPYHQNPSFRVMYSDNNIVTDYDQYTSNLEDIINNQMVVYNKSYTFTDIYGLTDVSCESLHKLYNKLHNNHELFDIYYKNYKPNNEYNICDTHCRNKLLNEIIF
jgi:predicted phosphodiesterase